MNKTEHYLTVVFPNMMSYVPGGHSYVLREDGAKQSAIRFCEVVKDLVEYCNENGVALGSGIAKEKYSVLETTVQFSVSTSLRKVRNRWKKFCTERNISCDDKLWRRQDGRSVEKWVEEWKLFREAVAFHIN